MTLRHYLGVTDFSRKETLELLERAHKLKQKWRAKHKPSKKLRGYTLAGIYEKPSLRTRVSFEAGMTQLGGHAIYLAPSDIKLGEREPAQDVARNLSRWVQIIYGAYLCAPDRAGPGCCQFRAGDQRTFGSRASLSGAGGFPDDLRA